MAAMFLRQKTIQTRSVKMDVIIDFSDRMGLVRDQGTRGTCLVFATTAAHEHLHGVQQPLCIEWLYYFAIKIEKVALNSWTTVPSVLEALEVNGQPYEVVWRYQGNSDFQQGHPPDNPGPLFYANSTVDAYDLDTVFDLLNQNCPTVITFETTYEFKFPRGVNGYSTVEYNPNPKKLGLHAAVAVGFGNLNGKKYVKLLNSYGTDWGDQGLTWISEEYLDVHADVILWLRNQNPSKE